MDIWSWSTYYDLLTLTSPALLCIYLVSSAQLYICHLILTLATLSCDLDIHCFHYVTLISMIMTDLSGIHYLSLIFLIPILDHIHWVTHYFALALINEINQVGVTWGDCCKRNSRRCAWKGGSSEGLSTRDLVIYARSCYYRLHDIWV